MNLHGRITRRRLLGRAAAAGMGALATSATGATAAVVSDQTFDVVVIGAGAAGMSAALGVLREDPGASVALLEAKPTHGGTSQRSGGRLWIPNNSDMRKAGIADPRPMALRYMARLAHPTTYAPDEPYLGLSRRHYRQLEAYYDQGAEILDYYRQRGMLNWEAERWTKFPWNADPLKLQGTYAPDYHPEFAENVPQRGRTIQVKHFDPSQLTASQQLPDPNYGASLAGTDLAQWLFYSALTHGVQVQFGARVLDLITSHPAGRLSVDGVVAQVTVDDVGLPLQRSFRARRGVVFAAGGFSKNRPRLDANFTGRHHFSGGGCAVTSARGDLVDIAGRYGLKLENMHQAWFVQNIYEQYKLDPDSRAQFNYLLFQAYWLNGDSMFMVNRRGQRVVNEKINYNDRTQAHFIPGNEFLYCIFDQHTLEHYIAGIGGELTPLVNTMVGPARDLPALRDAIARQMAGDPATAPYAPAPDFVTGAEATMGRFNDFARAGKDLDFHRGETAIEVWWHCFSLYFENVATPVPGVGVTDPVSANVDEHGNRYPNPTMRPLQGPFYAVVLSSGLQDTKGGPAIDAAGRILDEGGHHVPGLYGAGNCIASPAGAGYWGAGGTLGPAVVFGHIAGRHAARRS